MIIKDVLIILLCPIQFGLTFWMIRIMLKDIKIVNCSDLFYIGVIMSFSLVPKVGWISFVLMLMCNLFLENFKFKFSNNNVKHISDKIFRLKGDNND